MPRRLWAEVLLLAASCAWPQSIHGAERTVELAFADTEHQARVVGRAMRTGFLIDQLLIPETSYVGRVAWSELNPGLQSALESARPGEGSRPGVSRPDETLRIYRNRGDGSFEDVTAALGMARNIPTMGANFGDLDNDGYPDVYLGTGAPSYGMLIPNRMFLNRQGRGFVDVTTSTGTGHLQKGHGVAFADLDNDGDEDIFSNMGGAFPGDKYPNALFENPGHGNDWIAIELVGKRSNRSGVGARIRVVLDDDGKQKQLFRWVTSGGTFGASPLMQHIGLGRDAKILRIEIDWPAGAGQAGPERQVVRRVPTNSFIIVTEATPGFRLAPRPRFELGAGVSAAESHAVHGGG